MDNTIDRILPQSFFHYDLIPVYFTGRIETELFIELFCRLISINITENDFIILSVVSHPLEDYVCCLQAISFSLVSMIDDIKECHSDGEARAMPPISNDADSTLVSGICQLTYCEFL